jgi:hypothetical protein
MEPFSFRVPVKAVWLCFMADTEHFQIQIIEAIHQIAWLCEAKPFVASLEKVATRSFASDATKSPKSTGS